MYKYIAISILYLLTACSLGKDLTQDFTVGIQRNLSIEDIGRLKQMCIDNSAVILASVDPKAPKSVQAIGMYPYTFCKQLLTNQQNNADQGSLTWLPAVIDKINKAAMLAGVILG